MLGAITLTENVDHDKYEYFGYGIGFDVRGSFLLSNGRGFGKNVIIFGVDGSSSKYIYYKKTCRFDNIDDK